MRENTKIIIGLFAAAALIAGAFAGIAARHDGRQSAEGVKVIEVKVSGRGGDGKTHTIRTDAEFLRQALEEEDMIGGVEGAYGLFITEVDGVRADGGGREFWGVYRDGEMLRTGVDTTPIADGDRYELVLGILRTWDAAEN